MLGVGYWHGLYSVQLAQMLPRLEPLSEEPGEREAGERAEGLAPDLTAVKVVTRGLANEGR